MGEHLPCKQGVMGSNPIISTPETDYRRSKEPHRLHGRGLRNSFSFKNDEDWLRGLRACGLVAQLVRARA